ncbi:putative arabinosyltransferase ARAD1 [Iris pallida]|uniref:Arabinosyltransferase ARAD1 n=1 Tax=Iris pallida TaxID=29817 RepID=A0AAX6G4Q1_IRIPA|nr:putative arabinosyltransferase ARAD1 [Iris pallida]
MHVRWRCPRNSGRLAHEVVGVRPCNGRWRRGRHAAAVAVVVRMVMALMTRVRVWERWRRLGFLVTLIPC